MKRKILILGAGPIQLPIIRKASAMGLETIAADYNPNAVGRKYADTFLEVSTETGKLSSRPLRNIGSTAS